MDKASLWSTITQDLKTSLSAPSYHTFIKTMHLVELSGNKIVIGCDKPFFLSIVERNYKDLLTDLFESYTKISPIEIEFTTIATPTQKSKSESDPLPLLSFDMAPPVPYPSPLNPDYTFETFAVSTSNEMAYAAASHVAKNPGKSYNPLFLYGGVGVGKTHLMQSIGNALFLKNPQMKLAYLTGEQFTNEIIEAIGNKTTPQFRRRYRNVNLLCIDDVQFIAGKASVMEEFFHTFNAIQQGNGQIILTSDRPPAEIEKLESRLTSRFEGGLMIDIAPPDFELKSAILITKAKKYHVALSMDVAKFVASHVENIRKLEGVLIRLIAQSQTKNSPIDMILASSILKTDARESDALKSISPQSIINSVLSFYNLKISQIKSEKRDRDLALPRQVLYYLLRTEGKVPLMDIGHMLGGRDHTTIMHGVKKIENLINTDTKIRGDIDGIKNRFMGKQ